MATRSTNAGRDELDVHNRLDVVVLSLRVGDEAELSTTMTAAEARAVAELLCSAAETGEQTQGS
jgi:hypothetical protein